MKSYVVVAVIALIILAGVIFVTSSTSFSELVLESPTTADSAPNFTVTDLQGNVISLEENIAAGKPTVIYFMASWCPICAKSWDSLNEIYPEYAEDISFIAVSVDPTDSVEVLSELAEKKNFVFPTSPGNVALARDFNVYTQTTKVAINSDGLIVYKNANSFSTKEWRELFDKVK